jgi:DNA ligase-1
MQLAALVAAADDVAATSARKAKIERLAELLAAAAADEIAVVVGLISGDPHQGRIGVGWATVGGIAAAPAAAATHSVADLDSLLSTIAVTHGEGSQGQRGRLLASFLEGCTEAEADFVRRLLIGELRQGANAGIVTDAMAKACDVPATVLRRAVMLSGDLRATAEVARRGGRPALEGVGLELQRPIQPMLASTAKSVADAIDELGDVSVEWKLDGIRIQVHKDGDHVRVWTRNLNEITDGVPDVVALVRALPATSLVLDGEALGGSPFFFDLLHHDGEDLLNAPLRERLARLDHVTGDLKIPGIFTNDPAAGQAVLEDALAEHHEGVMVKAADSPYQAGRRGKTWRKIKPIHTFDLVVLAAEHGSGRREGWLSNIHLGARAADGSFVMVGKTFKGMTDEMLRWQTERFRELEVDDNGWQVTVRPEQVVEIAIDSVQQSTRYAGSIALRFARVVRYRSDKAPNEADTIETLQALGRSPY